MFLSINVSPGLPCTQIWCAPLKYRRASTYQVKAVLETALSETDAPLVVGDLGRGPGLVVGTSLVPFHHGALKNWQRDTAVVDFGRTDRVVLSARVPEHVCLAGSSGCSAPSFLRVSLFGAGST